MMAYHFVHLVLLAAGGKIEGRTKLQKMVYFAGVLTQMERHLGYRAHFYGPYSSQVTAAIDQLRSLGFLEQSKAGAGHVDPQGFEVARFDYALTDDGKRIAEDKAHAHPKLWDKIQHAVTRLNAADVSDYVQLSIAAKAYFLVNLAQGPVTYDNLVAMSKRFGWKVSPEQIAEAGNWLKSLNLVQDQHA